MLAEKLEVVSGSVAHTSSFSGTSQTVDGQEYRSVRETSEKTAEPVAHFVGTLSPFGAYSQVVTPSQAIYAETVTGSLLATPTMAAILVAWTVVPALAGYWWFSRVEL